MTKHELWTLANTPDNPYYKEMFEQLSDVNSPIGALTSEYYLLILGMVLLEGSKFLATPEGISSFKSYSAELLATGIEHGRRVAEVEALKKLV